jgi:hypothetical protein
MNHGKVYVILWQCSTVETGTAQVCWQRSKWCE